MSDPSPNPGERGAVDPAGPADAVGAGRTDDAGGVGDAHDEEPSAFDAIGALPRQVPGWVERIGRSSWYFLGFVGASGVVVLAIAATKELVIPFVLAVFLAAVFTPIVDGLERRRVPRAIGAALVVVGIMGLFVAVGAVVVGSLVAQQEELVESVDDASTELQAWFDDLDLDPELVEEVRTRISDSSGEAGSGITGQAVGVLGTIFAIISGIVLGIVMLYYLLKDGRVVARWALDLAESTRPGRRGANRELMIDSIRSVRAYFKGRSILALVQAVVIGVAAAVLGVPLAAAIAVVNFIGAYIPYLGAVVGGGFAVLLAISSGGIAPALIILAVVLAVNLILENALEPLLLGSALKLHPLAVLVATILGGLVAGLVGLILAAPAAAIATSAYTQLVRSGFFDEDEADDRVVVFAEVDED